MRDGGSAQIIQNSQGNVVSRLARNELDGIGTVVPHNAFTTLHYPALEQSGRGGVHGQVTHRRRADFLPEDGDTVWIPPKVFHISIDPLKGVDLIIDTIHPVRSVLVRREETKDTQTVIDADYHDAPIGRYKMMSP
jgi:hypothetical protein